MGDSIKNDQRGLAHVAMIVIAVVVIGAIGFVGWRVTQKKSPATNNVVTEEVAKEIAAECKKEIDDKDLCKFFTSWGNMKKFGMTSTDTSEGVTTKSIFKIDGNKTYMMTEGEMPYEIIIVDKTTYTKAGEYWWKQTSTTEEIPSLDTDALNFEEPNKDEPEANQTKYEKQGKEACGNLTCFKYKVIDPANAESVEYLWFDDKDYLSRRTRTEGSDGSVSEQIYSYDNISVSEPSPVKELQPGQYIMPGQTEPMSL